MTDIKMEKVKVSPHPRAIEGEWTIDYSEPDITIWGFCPSCKFAPILIAEITGKPTGPYIEPPIISREIDGVTCRVCSCCGFSLGKEEDFSL